MSSSSFFDIPTSTKSGSSSLASSLSGNRVSHRVSHLPNVVTALVASAHDRDAAVTEDIGESIVQIGRKKPEIVIDITCRFLSKERAATGHRVVLLRCLQRIVELCQESITVSLAEELVNLSISEMTMERDIHSDWQGAAALLLTSVCVLHPDPVIDALSSRIVQGHVPHYFVMKALADFANANPEGLVPRLREIVARLVPIMGQVNHDNMKWVFAFALSRFSDAVVHYHYNHPQESIESLGFTQSLFPAFDLILVQWIQQREARVRLACVEALGLVSRILSEEDLVRNGKRVIDILLQMLKRERLGDIHCVAVGLSGVIGALAESTPGRDVMSEILMNVLQNIHPAACRPPSVEEPTTLKASSEFIRCFEILGRHFTDQVVTFLQRSMDNREPMLRAGTLGIIKHFISRIDDILPRYRDTLISIALPQMDEPSWVVRRDLVQLIVIMAQYNYLSLAGGSDLLRYLVRQAALPEQVVAQSDAEARKKNMSVSAGDVRIASTNILTLMVNTMSVEIDHLIWPSFLEYIVSESTFEASVVLLKCVATLSQRKHESQDASYFVDFDHEANLPRPTEIFARLIVEAGLALRAPKRVSTGLNAVRCMTHLAEILHAGVADVVCLSLQELEAVLEENEISAEEWECRMEQFVGSLLSAVSDDEWCSGFVTSLIDVAQTAQGKNLHSLYKRIAFRMAGVALRECGKRTTIRPTIDRVLALSDPHDVEQREGCALFLGLASEVHYDPVLDQIRTCLAVSKGGIFSKSKGPSEETKAMVLLALGFVSLHLPLDMLVARLDVYIIDNVLPLLQEGKSYCVIEAALRAIEMVARAMHQDRLGESFTMTKRRDDLILSVLRGCSVREKNPSDTIKLRLLGLQTVHAIFSLDPLWTREFVEQIIKLLEPFVLMPPHDLPMSSSASSSSLASSSSSSSLSSKKDVDSDESSPDLAQQFFSAWSTLVSWMVVRCGDSVTETLHCTLEWLSKLSTREESFIRERALDAIVASLKAYAKFAKDIVEQGSIPLVVRMKDMFITHLGVCTGMLAGRTTDTSLICRQQAADALFLLYRIHHYLETFASASPDATELSRQLPDHVAVLRSVKNSVDVVDSRELFSVAKEVSASLGHLIPPDQLRSLIDGLMRNLEDSVLDVANGVCVILNGILRVRGPELKPDVFPFVINLVSSLPKLRNREQTINGILHATRALARHHLHLVCDALLDFPLPPQDHVVRAVQVLAGDPVLQPHVFERFIDVLNHSQLFEDTRHMRGSADARNKIEILLAKGLKRGVCLNSKLLQREFSDQVCPTLGHCMVVPLLRSIIDLEETAETVVRFRVPLLYSLLLHVGIAHMCQDSFYVKDVMESISTLLKTLEEERVLARMEEKPTHDDDDDVQVSEWEKLKNFKLYLDGCSSLVSFSCQSVIHDAQEDDDAILEYVTEVFRYVAPFSKRPEEGFRLVSCAILGELIEFIQRDRSLLTDVVNTLITCMSDESQLVRMIAAHAIGNIGLANRVEVNRFATSVISSLMGFIESDADELVLESLDALAKIFDNVDEQFVSPVLVNLCLRLKPTFENSTPKVRTNAFTLFGVLAPFGAQHMSFMDQFHAALPAMLVHATDKSRPVRGAAKLCIRRLIPLCHAPAIEELFLSKAFDPDILLNFEEFMDRLAPLLVEYYDSSALNLLLMNLVGFFRSEWDIIRASAAYAAGSILHSLPDETKDRVNLEHFVSAIISLLREPTPSVRSSASKALSVLFEV